MSAAITTTAAGTAIFQSFLPPVAGSSAACTEDEEPAAATEADEPDGRAAETCELESRAAGTVPELPGTDPETDDALPCRDSVSRFSRFRSARMSAAC